MLSLPVVGNEATVHPCIVMLRDEASVMTVAKMDSSCASMTDNGRWLDCSTGTEPLFQCLPCLACPLWGTQVGLSIPETRTL